MWGRSLSKVYKTEMNNGTGNFDVMELIVLYCLSNRNALADYECLRIQVVSGFIQLLVGKLLIFPSVTSEPCWPTSVNTGRGDEPRRQRMLQWRSLFSCHENDFRTLSPSLPCRTSIFFLFSEYLAGRFPWAATTGRNSWQLLTEAIPMGLPMGYQIFPMQTRLFLPWSLQAALSAGFPLWLEGQSGSQGFLTPGGRWFSSGSTLMWGATWRVLSILKTEILEPSISSCVYRAQGHFLICPLIC